MQGFCAPLSLVKKKKKNLEDSCRHLTFKEASELQMLDNRKCLLGALHLAPGLCEV